MAPDYITTYKAQHQKHEIHIVDYNRRIAFKEVDIDEFAVTLTLSHTKPPKETFRGETDRYFKQLRGTREFGIKLSELIDSKSRLIFVTAIAGSGKSVLVKQLTFKWANGELFNEFKMCITFECRELNYFALNEGKKFDKHELIIEFIKGRFGFDLKDAKNVLFIVDGLDELYDLNENGSIIGQLLDLNKSKYLESKIIITGRPHIENMLSRHGKNMGGFRKFEIIGLSDQQIDDYIRKFASSDDEIIAKIKRTMDNSKNNLHFLYIPQMLNSFCCVALLSEETGIKNAAELYCWSFYLLLKQHAEKDGSRDKRISEIFNEHSNDLFVLSKICHELLNRNTIIFEGNIQFGDVGNGKEFLKGLFVDVSDNFLERQQFKHLTLMEFLSAVYVCTTEIPTEIIKDVLKKRLYQVLLFYCELISGSMYDGIIKEMFTNSSKLRKIDCCNFFCNILKLVRECVEDDYDVAFKLSLDVILCLMNKCFINKQLILWIVNQLIFKNVNALGMSDSTHKLIEIMKLLIRDFECLDIELKEAFENVHFGSFVVNELNELKYLKFLAYVYEIEVGGAMEVKTVRDIRKEVDEVHEYGKCKRVRICGCKLQDEDFEDEVTETSKLEFLQLESCNLNEQSFIILCKWIITSSVEEFRLISVENMKVERWNVLVDAIVNAKEKNNGDFSLKMLEIFNCPLMNDEMNKKEMQSTLLQHPVNPPSPLQSNEEDESDFEPDDEYDDDYDELNEDEEEELATRGEKRKRGQEKDD